MCNLFLKVSEFLMLIHVLISSNMEEVFLLHTSIHNFGNLN